MLLLILLLIISSILLKEAGNVIKGICGKIIKYLISPKTQPFTINPQIIIIIIIKRGRQCRLREIDIYPISPKTSAPQYQPIDRKKRKGKIVENYSRDRAAWLIKKHWPCS